MNHGIATLVRSELTLGYRMWICLDSRGRVEARRISTKDVAYDFDAMFMRIAVMELASRRA